ncbi:MAG TPA: DUF1579 family protein [Candidatus Udaeobacter sp.]|nr:DUF1579 family protein [Candidatus Udaeobacter sp.]
MNRLILICLCSFAFSITLFAQAPAASPIATAAVTTQASTPAGQPSAAQLPKPGPEAQKLAYYLGTWEGQGETKGGPFGPAGKLSSTITCDWFTGGFQLVCRGEERGPTGKRAFLNILAYDEKAKAYAEYGISSLGESEYSTGGSLVGNKRIFVKDLDGIKLRYTETQVSPVLYTYLAEASKDGGPWTVIAEGKVTKVR